MNSFTDTIKRHGLILWLVHLFAKLISFGVLFLFVVAGLLTAVGIGVTTLFSVTMREVMDSVQAISPMVLGGSVLGFGFIGMIVYLLVYSFGAGGTIAVTANALEKDKADIQTFFKEGLRNMWRMAGLTVLSILLYIPVGAVLSGAGYMFVIERPGIGFILGIVSIALTILLILGILFAPYILVIENRSILQSIGASFGLLKNAFGKVVMTVLILMGIGVSVLIPMATMGIGTAKAPIFNPFYDFIFAPIIAALVSLTVIYRYFKYMRPALNLAHTREESKAQAVEEDVNDEMDKTEY